MTTKNEEKSKIPKGQSEIFKSEDKEDHGQLNKAGATRTLSIYKSAKNEVESTPLFLGVLCFSYNIVGSVFCSFVIAWSIYGFNQ